MTPLLTAARRWWHYLAAALLTVVLRLPGMANGLPYVRHPDEPVNYLVTHRMVAGPSLLPHFYDYPSLQYAIQSAVHASLLWLGRLFGVWHSSADLGMIGPTGFGNSKAMSTSAWLVARGVTVTVSVVGVVAVVHIATRLCRSRRWAFLAGAFGAVSGIGVASGFTMTPDALAGTTATLTLACLASLLADDRGATGRRWVVVTGICLGLAVGSKYNNVLLVGVVVLAVALTDRSVRPTLRQTAIVMAIGAGVFVLTTPAVVFDRVAFLDSVRGVLRHYSVGHFGSEGDSLSFNLKALWHSDAVALVFAGAAVALRSRRQVVMLATWVVAYTLVISKAQVHFARNLTPVLGAVAVLGGLGAQQVWIAARAQWTAKDHVRVRQTIVTVVLLAALTPVAVMQARRTGHDLRVQLTDYQGAARRWLERTVPPGSNALLETYSPWLDLETHDVTQLWFIFGASAQQLEDADVAVITSSGSGRFLQDPTRYPDQIAALRSVTDRACDTRSFSDGFGYTVDVLFLRCDS